MNKLSTKSKAMIVMLLACLLACLTVLSGCGSSSSGSSSSGGSDKAEEADEQAPEAASGELQYTGTSSAQDLEKITVSFILSEDKTTIHDFTIDVENFTGSADIPGARVTVELKGTTTTVMSEINVDYAGENRNLPVGDCTIESLQFAEDGTAEMVFTYCFKQTTPEAFEIPVPGIEFSLTSGPAPAGE